MKSKFLLFTMLFGLSFANCKTSDSVIANAGIQEQMTIKSVYEENFENCDIGDDKDAIWSKGSQFLWTEGRIGEHCIIEHNGSKALEITLENVVDGDRIGGLGTGGQQNLSKLVAGQKYDVYLDVEFISANPEAKLVVDYYNTQWQAVDIYNDGRSEPHGWAVDSNYIWDLKTFKFTIIAMERDGSTANTYIQLFLSGLNLGEKLILDNLKITPHHTVLATDFNKYNQGDNTNANNGVLTNIYNAPGSGIYFDNIEIDSVGNTNKYLKATKAVDPSDLSDRWTKFSINGLTSMVLGHMYRVEFDLQVLEGALNEFYVTYPESGPGNYGGTYGFTYSIKEANENVYAASFNGTRVSLTFVANTDVGWWQQVTLTFKHNQTIVVKIDNLSIYTYGLVVDHAVEFVNDFKSLLSVNGGSLSICDHLDATNEYMVDAQLQTVLEKYHALSELDKMEVRAHVLWSENGADYTIGEMIDYVVSLSESARQSAGVLNPSQYTLSLTNDAVNSPITLLVLLSVVVIAGYVVISKRRTTVNK